MREKLSVIATAIALVAIIIAGLIWIWWWVQRPPTRVSPAEVTQLVCTAYSEPKKPFESFEKPFLGFTEEVEVGGKRFAGWYLVEARYKDALPFKAFFFEDVFVDGLEIGERFETLREVWGKTEFIDYPTLLDAFKDIATNAPRCAPASQGDAANNP